MIGLGFSKDAIDTELKTRENLEEFSYYDVFEILNEKYEKLRTTDQGILTISQRSDLTKALLALGFNKEWARKYTWMAGEAFADQTVIATIRICLLDRLSNYRTVCPYPVDENKVKTNCWNKDSETSCHIRYIRYQERQSCKDLGKNEDEIELGTLKRKFQNDAAGGTTYWFHATSWDNAKSIAQNGPRISGERTDFSSSGAFYLNDDYCDCYQWFTKRNSVFKGRHAMLIYRFDLAELQGGKELENDEWKVLVYNCREEDGKKSCERWYYGPQCENPTNLKSKKQVTSRYRGNGRDRAMQLGIIHVRTLTFIHKCLVAIVFYRNVNPNCNDCGKSTMDTSSYEPTPNQLNTSASISSSNFSNSHDSASESSVDLSDIPRNENRGLPNKEWMSSRSCNRSTVSSPNKKKRKRQK